MSTTKSYYRTNGDVPLLTSTIYEHFQLISRRFPDQSAVIALPQQRRLSYTDLVLEIDLLARGLLALGAGKGDNIGIWSTNNLEWLLIQMSCARIGAVLVNINPAYRPGELSYALNLAEVKILFVIPSFRSSNYVTMLLELIPELLDAAPGIPLTSSKFPSLKQVVLYDPVDPMATTAPAPGFTLWQQVMAKADTVKEQLLDPLTAELNPYEPANIQFTSGTTGAPKAVVLSHYNILNNAFFSALAMHFGNDDRLCVSVPFYHCFGTVLANLLCFSCGPAWSSPVNISTPCRFYRVLRKSSAPLCMGCPPCSLPCLTTLNFHRLIPPLCAPHYGRCSLSAAVDETGHGGDALW